VTAAAVVVVVLLLLPVLLLPLTTSVPVWAWLPLLVLGLGALVWLVAGRRRRWVRPAAVGVVAIAAGGLAMSFGVDRRPAADPHARFPRPAPLSTARELIAIRADSLLFKVVLTTVFVWFAGSMLIQFITVMAVEQFEWGEAVGGYLVAAELVGLAAGGLLASRLGEGRWYRVIGPCMMAMAVVLLVAEMLPFMPASARLASAYGLLGAVGVLGGVVMIPCEAFIQRRPPAGRKGTVIASSNFGVFFGILVSGPLANAANAVLDEPTRGMALMGAVTLVVGALLRRAFAKEKGS